jgi:hypothetical protein
MAFILFIFIILIINLKPTFLYKKKSQQKFTSEKFKSKKDDSIFVSRCDPKSEYCISHTAGPLKTEERQKIANLCRHKNTPLYTINGLKPSFADIEQKPCYINVYNSAP